LSACSPKSGSVLAEIAFPLHASEIIDKSETGRERNVSVPAKFLPIQILFVPAGPKSADFREKVTKNVTSSKKNIRVRERHFLPRKITKVAHYIFGHRKSDKRDVTHPHLR